MQERRPRASMSRTLWIDCMHSQMNSARIAVLRSVTNMVMGNQSEEELTKILAGESEVKVKAPANVRMLMDQMGMGHAVEQPFHILTTSDESAVLVADEEPWEDLEFEVALDSELEPAPATAF